MGQVLSTSEFLSIVASGITILGGIFAFFLYTREQLRQKGWRKFEDLPPLYWTLYLIFVVVLWGLASMSLIAIGVSVIPSITLIRDSAIAGILLVACVVGGMFLGGPILAKRVAEMVLFGEW